MLFCKTSVVEQVLERTISAEYQGGMVAFASVAEEAQALWGVRTGDNLKKILSRGTMKTKYGFECFPEGDPLKMYVQLVEPWKNYFDVAMHGTPTGVCFGSFEEPNMSARLLAEVIRHSDGYHGQPVRLLSCSTGLSTDGSYCFAEELANALGVPVRAPNDVLIIWRDGSLKIGFAGNGEFIEYRPNQRRRMK